MGGRWLPRRGFVLSWVSTTKGGRRWTEQDDDYSREGRRVGGARRDKARQDEAMENGPESEVGHARVDNQSTEHSVRRGGGNGVDVDDDGDGDRKMGCVRFV